MAKKKWIKKEAPEDKKDDAKSMPEKKKKTSTDIMKSMYGKKG